MAAGCDTGPPPHSQAKHHENSVLFAYCGKENVDMYGIRLISHVGGRSNTFKISIMPPD